MTLFFVRPTSTRTRFLSPLLSMLFFLNACAQEQAPETNQLNNGTLTSKSDYSQGEEYPWDFPAEQDLAILLPLEENQMIHATDVNAQGQEYLSRYWLGEMNRGYLPTIVKDAMERENVPQDWVLVSVRIVPCNPLGLLPDQAPETYCWPQVRLTWQPVLFNYTMPWGSHAESYADDRAIHALYRVPTQPLDGTSMNEPSLKAMLEHLKEQIPLGMISQETEELFLEERDRAAGRLLQGALELRGNEPVEGDLYGLELRRETQWGWEDADAFRDRLRRFLDEFAQPRTLHLLTGFSLPEGRIPAQHDNWTFLSFKGVDGGLQQVPINVIGKESGDELVNIGMSQTVRQTKTIPSEFMEDPAVLDALYDPYYGEELKRSVITHRDQVPTLGAEIADSTRTMVHNTTCASCHVLNDNAFNLHSLSYLEQHRKITISPRVVSDVSNDLRWAQNYLGHF